MDKWFTHYSETQFLFLNDLLLGPIFILIAYGVSKSYIKGKTNSIYHKYFIPALMIRFACAVLLALVYQYYYKGGDTLTYFTYVQSIRDIFSEDRAAFYNFALMAPPNEFLVENHFGAGKDFFMNESSNMVIRLALYLSYPMLNTYILISFCFSLFCFYGCWKIFVLFHELYPHLEKQLAFSCLFLPSVCFWGTGILKDPICLGALGAVTYHFYKLFFTRTKIISRSIFILFCFLLIKEIKIYVILAFLPAYAFWIIFRFKETIKSKILRSIMAPLLFVFSLIIGAFVFVKIAAVAERYAFDSLIRTAKDTQNWLYLSSQTQGGSGYSLGDVEYTPMGMLKVFPKAVNVSLFRPYIWEARKPILIPAALEGLLSLFLTIRLLYKAGFVRFTKLIITNPEVQFCLVFSVIFAFSVGFTSYNFGSLVRYKIPLMPFYYMALFILADKEKEPEVAGKSGKPLTSPLIPVNKKMAAT
ncbi:MAG: hypothetical protein RL222_1751 [Bacteroidota bacterium]|jgi:hypothetical protein